MSNPLDPLLIARWLVNDLSPEDERTLAEWLAADPARAVELEELGELWRRAGEAAESQATAPDPAEEARWAGVLRAIRDSERMAKAGSLPRSPSGTSRTFELPFSRRRNQWARGAIAAAAIGVAVAGGLSLIGDRHGREVAQVSRPMRAYETGRGERAEFRLKDGTRVMLNVESRVRVPAGFGERNRTVYVEGGAYFDVEHDVRRPFVVLAGDIGAEDLGTEFIVRAYPEDRHARVVVRSGKVVLHPSADSGTAHAVTLGPGQLGRIDALGRPLVESADTAAEFAWTGGTLVLDGTALREALPQLGRWFDLDFRLADSSLGGIPVATVLSNQPTDEALSFLAASLGLRAVRRDGVVTFYPGRPGR